jgi:hypothetical protein
MHDLRFVSPVRAFCALLAAALLASAHAQTAPAKSTDSAANDAFLARAVKLYYSSTKAGLSGFDCALHPDWRALYAARNSGTVSADDQPRVDALNSVAIVLHGRMAGGSTMDWNQPDRPFDTDTSKLLSDMHNASNETIMGFLQFWTPFVDGTVVPDSSSGLEMTATEDGGKRIHLAQTDVDLTEVFDSGSILREYDVTMGATTINLTPTFSPSDHGLLITHFHAIIHQGVAPQQTTQEMNVEVAYFDLEGIPIPSRLDMDVTGVADFHFALDGCTVSRK